MKNSLAAPVLSPRISGAITLPNLGDAPGPLHTVLWDECDNIYYSDEINHSLVSLKGSGEIRWHRSKQGTSEGEFRYPKGIALGWIEEGGAKTECLAVCDSWNRRIQFFDQNGSYLTSWNKIGGDCFGDPVDIRFLQNTSNLKTAGPCWLILDRGRHALLAADLCGRQVFQVGRTFPDTLEARWPMPCDSAQLQSSSLDLIRKCIRYDPLFMPARVFGGTEESLFIWEPKSNHLKRAASGNMIPVWIQPPDGSEWIGADSDALLCFEKRAGLIWRYEGRDPVWRSIQVRGAPIPGCSTQEIWLQDCSLLQHLFFDLQTGEEKEHGRKHSWIVCGLPDEIADGIKSGIAPAHIEKLRGITVRLRVLAQGILDEDADKWSDPAITTQAKNELTSLTGALTAALAEMRGFAYLLFIGLLKIQVVQSSFVEADSRPYCEKGRGLIRVATTQVTDLFAEMLSFRDDWFLARLAQEDASESQTDLLQECYNAVMRVVKELGDWLWWIPFFERNPSGSPKTGVITAHQELSAIAQKDNAPIALGSASFLHEIDRIFVGNNANSDCVWPAAICHAPGLGFWVSLNSSGQLLHLSEQGKVLEVADLPSASDHPHGLAIDDSGRIWILLASKNRIGVYDPGTGRMQTLEDLTGRKPALKYPMGIYNASGGRMLVADTQNNRIQLADGTGLMLPLVHTEGKNLGELRHPVAFCGTGRKEEFWVVESKNHRLQRFNMSGQVLQRIGNAGLGKGSFVQPESAGVFKDGMLVVSQRVCTSMLKFFSMNGEEIETFPLDYAPGGILVHNSFMLVCEAFGNHIRVYERCD